MYGAHIDGSANITSTGTSTVFAAQGSGTRWSFTKGLITVYVGTGVALIDLIETDSTGSDTATFFTVSGSAPMVLPIDFGEHGINAASTNSRLALQTTGSNCNVTCLFAGYVR